MRRRSFVHLFALAALGCTVGCKKKASGPRCLFCGMAVKDESAFRVKAKTESGEEASFDTPRCALEARVAPKYKVKSLQFQEFYDRTWHDASELRFIADSDVLGPMGHDLIPVVPAHVEKFMRDHKGKRSLAEKEITESILDHLGESH